MLVSETRGLRFGESADPQTVESIRTIANSDQAVAHAASPLTLHLGADQILIALDIQFHRELSAEQIATAIERMGTAIRKEHPRVKQMFLEARRFREIFCDSR